MLRPVFLVDGWARFREMPWNYCFLFILQCWLSIPGLFNRMKLLFSMNNYIWTILMPQEMSCVHTGLWDGIFTSLVFPHRGLSDEPIRKYIFVCDSWSQLVIEIRQNVNADVPLWKETRGLFLESPETIRAYFGWHNSLWIFKTKGSRGTKLCSYFYFYSLYNIWKDQLYRISRS